MLRRGKPIAILTAACAILTLGAGGLAFRRPVLERYYLYRLARAPDEEKAAIVERLGEVGSEESLLKISQLSLESFPASVLRWLYLTHSRETVAMTGMALTAAHVPELDRACTLAGREIRERLGTQRLSTMYRRAFERGDLAPRQRVLLAQMILIGSSLVTDLPEPLKAMREDTRMPDRSVFLPARPVAIEACIASLSSEDELCRAGAAFGLSLCGPEAKPAIPALEKAAGDPVNDVRESAAEALRRIRSGS
jgi:hypothetical protein